MATAAAAAVLFSVVSSESTSHMVIIHTNKPTAAHSEVKG